MKNNSKTFRTMSPKQVLNYAVKTVKMQSSRKDTEIDVRPSRKRVILSGFLYSLHIHYVEDKSYLMLSVGKDVFKLKKVYLKNISSIRDAS